jgi:hypothetical protein
MNYTKTMQTLRKAQESGAVTLLLAPVGTIGDSGTDLEPTLVKGTTTKDPSSSLPDAVALAPRSKGLQVRW